MRFKILIRIFGITPKKEFVCNEVHCFQNSISLKMELCDMNFARILSTVEDHFNAFFHGLVLQTLVFVLIDLFFV